jgi:BASS family bile acid:Na+ symporter
LILKTDILINLVLALITFSLGLTLTHLEFKNLWLNPRALVVGLCSQLILLPILAMLIIGFYNLPPEFAVGFFIISICPGGVSSNMVSYFLNGNVALSMSLTVINSIITLFSIPLLANIAIGFLDGANRTSSFTLPFWETFWSIFLVTILPATLGVITRAFFKQATKSIRPLLRYVLPVLLMSIFIIKIFADKEAGGVELTSSEYIEILPASLMLNLFGMLTGLFVGTLMLVKFKNRITVIVEIGLQNTTLALLITGVIMDNPQLEKPALVYATFSFFSTLILGWMFKYVFFKWRKWLKKEVHPSEW